MLSHYMNRADLWYYMPIVPLKRKKYIYLKQVSGYLVNLPLNVVLMSIFNIICITVQKKNFR